MYLTCDTKSAAALRATPQPAPSKRYVEDRYLPAGYANHSWVVAISETDGPATVKKKVQAPTKRPG
jgi:hypothetical protein